MTNRKTATEPREAALQQVEHATAGQQERTRRLVDREAHDGDQPQSQSERFIAKARELGLDEREETFDAALTEVLRHEISTEKK